MKSEIGWVVQKNLTSDRYVYDSFQRIFEKHKIPYEFVDIIPFSGLLPEFKKDRINIFYGSTSMMDAVYNSGFRDGLFFNPETFRMDLYIEEWGILMLNDKAKITTLKELCNQDLQDDEFIFIRPIDDSKLFNGQVKTFSEIKNWKKNFQVMKDNLLTEDTAILAGAPYKINKEWRNIIVNGKVISSSRYYRDGYLSKSATDIPYQVIELCEMACEIFTPHDIFAMDIAETGGEYYILECGCANSVGFYEIDMEKVILAIQDYMNEKFNPPLIIKGESDCFNYDSGLKINPKFLNKE